MKLDIDCVRSLLMALEDVLQFDDDLHVPSVNLSSILSYPTLKDFSRPDVAYATEKLKEADFISATIQYGSLLIYDIRFHSITYAGHEFLEAIRPDTVWQETKSTLASIGTYSIKAASDIAKSVLASVITKIITQ